MDITSNQSGSVVIGDFRIERRIGAGGMGIVYLATQMSLNRLVALKVLGDRLKRPGDKARFQREAQAVAKLKHPNIASVYFIGQDNRLCYIAMEYIDGISLREFIDRLARTTKRDSSLEELLQSSVRISEDLELFDVSAETVRTDDSIEPDSQSALTPEAEYSISTTQHTLLISALPDLLRTQR
jgi:serine/threonine protein kinase